ncbi:hypothetical protein [Leptolyngbya sp. FACHB-36]|uniref:hypothetical protein n=1 Tax=Leptolyngbya sp. FACHB-36 TaxID=2692808 RepID=UPI001A7E51F9|nr:hypothetical protein [Leptolyngbya sp. FACHB-36]
MYSTFMRLWLGLGALGAVLLTQSALAQSGLEGSYVGVAVDGSALQDELPNLLKSIEPQDWIVDAALRQMNGAAFNSQSSQSTAGSQFQGRYDVPNSPISVRGTVFVHSERSAVLPILSYDLPVGSGTNLYAGAGYAIVRPGTVTPLGTQSGMVLTTGIEASAGKNLVIYGDTKLNLNQDRSGNASSLRFQFGAGYRF